MVALTRRRPRSALERHQLQIHGQRPAMPQTRVPSPSKTPARRPAKGRAMRSIAPAAGGRALPLGGRGQGLVGLFRELKSEIRKVNWPTPRQAANMTGVIV